MKMAEQNDNQNSPTSMPTGPGTGLSFSTLRRAALMLLLISAPAFLITLQLRRHDLRQTHGAVLMQHNISELRGIVNQSADGCTDSPVMARPLLRATSLDAVRPHTRERGLAVLLSPTHALAAASEPAHRLSSDPCGGV